MAWTKRIFKDATWSLTAPSSPTVGQLWIDFNSNPPIPKEWSGSAWVTASGEEALDAEFFNAFQDEVIALGRSINAASAPYNMSPSASGSANVSALNSALAAAGVAGGGVLIPAGNYTMSGQVSGSDVFIIGDPKGTVLTWTGGVSAGAYALTLTSTLNLELRSGMRDVVMQTSALGSQTLGNAPVTYHGLYNDHRIRLDNVTIMAFNRGHTCNSAEGHCRWDGCVFEYNYYGLYFPAQGAAGEDYLMLDSECNGNMFAGIGIAEDGMLIDFNYHRGHCGFQPYGVYQESGSTVTPMLHRCHFEHVAFESIGNAAIFTEKANTGTNDNGAFYNIYIKSTGFGWADSKKIAARNQDYAVRCGGLFFNGYYEPGTWPFIKHPTAGLAAWWIGNKANNITTFNMQGNGGGGAQAVTVANGSSSMFNWIPSGGGQGFAQIPSGATKQVVVSTEYSGHSSCVKPRISVLGAGGLTGAFTTYVDSTTVSSDANAGTTVFTVKLISAANPTSTIDFYWWLGW